MSASLVFGFVIKTVAYVVMEAVSALQHAHVLWTHVLMTDDAGIFNVELQLAH